MALRLALPRLRHLPRLALPLRNRIPERRRHILQRPHLQRAHHGRARDYDMVSRRLNNRTSGADDPQGISTWSFPSSQRS